MNAVSQLIQFIMPLAQIDPNVIKRLNPQRITTMGVDILRAPPSVVYTEEEAQEIAEEAEPKTVRMLHCIDVETVWETKDVTPG